MVDQIYGQRCQALSSQYCVSPTDQKGIAQKNTKKESNSIFALFKKVRALFIPQKNKDLKNCVSKKSPNSSSKQTTSSIGRRLLNCIPRFLRKEKSNQSTITTKEIQISKTTETKDQQKNIKQDEVYSADDVLDVMQDILSNLDKINNDITTKEKENANEAIKKIAPKIPLIRAFNEKISKETPEEQTSAKEIDTKIAEVEVLFQAIDSNSNAMEMTLDAYRPIKKELLDKKRILQLNLANKEKTEKLNPISIEINTLKINKYQNEQELLNYKNTKLNEVKKIDPNNSLITTIESKINKCMGNRKNSLKMLDLQIKRLQGAKEKLKKIENVELAKQTLFDVKHWFIRGDSFDLFQDDRQKAAKEIKLLENAIDQFNDIQNTLDEIDRTSFSF